MHPLELEHLHQDLAFLCGPEAAGRLSGTEGARGAAAYLAGELQAAGYRPAGAEGYFQPLDVFAARLRGPARLVIGDRELQHRSDFAEMAMLSGGGAVSSSLAVVRDGDAVDPAALAGRVVLIPERPAGFDLAATAAGAADAGVAALLVEYGEPQWFHKTVYGSPGNRIPVLRVRTSAAAELAGRAGAPVQLSLPLVSGSLACRNVLGLLPGAQPDRTVVLAAHYDHVGDDPGGVRFPGAEDNASGVAAVLAAARRLARLPGPLPFNVLVAFLTGEESGLWGARHLAAHPPVPLSAVINLDGLGVEPELAVMRLGHRAPGHWLAVLAANVLHAGGATAAWIAGSDDSAAFMAAGVPAIGLGQQPTGPRHTALHTPDDTPAALRVSAALAGAACVAEMVIRLAAPAAWPQSQSA